MFLMRVLEAVMAGGVMVGALVLWRPCSASSSRSLRVLRWLVVVVAAFGVGGLFGAAALKVSLRAALARDAVVNTARPLLEAAIVCGIVVLAGSWVLTLVRLGVPRFRTRSTWGLKYDAVALTVCVALLVTSLELPFEGRRQLTPEQRVALLDRSLRALEDGDREMPRDTWDPDYVVKMVGRDHQRLFRWVQQNTYWIPYHGVLRGPVGVLMDRQGNSLDRAILLAVLLEKAGHTVRLAHGALERQQAVNLLPTLVADRQIAFTRQPVASTPDRGVQQVAAQYQLDGNDISNTLQAQVKLVWRMSSELQVRVTDQTDRLLKAIDRPKEAEVWGRTFDAALAALADHWWVQRQDGLNWVDLDLLADRGKPDTALVAASQTTAVKDLPAEMHHNITLRVIAEQWARGKLQEYKALEQELRPADLIGQPIILQFWPTSWMADEKPGTPLGDWKTDVLAQHEWDAVLAVGSKVLSTTTIPDSGDDPYAPKGGDFGGLASAFSASMNVPSQSENKTLSAVWLEYEVRVPGEKPQTIRRNVFDLIGPAARATSSPRLVLDETKRLSRSLALGMQTEILPMVGGLSHEFGTHLLAQSLLGDRDLFQFLMQGHLPAGIGSFDQLFERSSPPLSSLYLLALARMKWGKPEEVFLDRPNLLTRHIYAAPSGKNIVMRDATDIVANEVGVSLTARDGFAARLEQGVLDTNAESLVRMAEETLDNAGDAFAVSQRWKAIRSDQDAAALGKLDLAENVRRQIAADLSRGYAVVAPESAVKVKGEPFSGWWRIDRDTGDSLGFGSNGWGTTTVEESSHNARTAETAPRWLVAMKTFARVFPVAFGGYYGWCVTPLIVKHVGELPDAAAETVIRNPDTLNNPVATAAKTVLHHSLGIWEGAVKPSVEHCVGDAIVVGGITALFAVVAVVGEAPTPRGQSEPFEPPKDPCAGDQALSPEAQSTSAPSAEELQDVSPEDPDLGPRNRYAEIPSDVSRQPPPWDGSTPTPEQVEDALESVLRWRDITRMRTTDYVRYQARMAKGGEYYDPGTYEPEIAQQKLDAANSADRVEGKWYDRFEELYMAYKAKYGVPPRMPKLSACAVDNAPASPGGQSGNTVGLGPGNTRPVGPGGPPSPIGPPIGPPPGTFPPQPGSGAVGPGQTQPVSPGGPPPGTGPPGSQGSPPPGSSPPGPGQTQQLSPGGPPPGTAPPGPVDPYAKTVVGLSSAADVLGKP